MTKIRTYKLKNNQKNNGMVSLSARFAAAVCVVISTANIDGFWSSSQSRSQSGSIFVMGAVQNMDILLQATPDIVQYDEGTIRKKGIIDLTELTFTASMGSYYSVNDPYQENTMMDDLTYQQQTEPTSSLLSPLSWFGGGAANKDNMLLSTLDSETYQDDLYDQGGDDDGITTNGMYGNTGDDETLFNPRTPYDDDLGSGNHRHNYRHRRLDGGIDHDATFVDVLIFPIPKSCSRSSKNCPWVDLGIGKYVNTTSTSSTTGISTTSTELRWCCSDEAVALGVCSRDSKEYGRLLIDSTKFLGEQRSISVPKSSTFSTSSTGEMMMKHLNNPVISVGNKKSLKKKIQQLKLAQQQQIKQSGGTTSKHLRYSALSQTYVIMFSNCLPLEQGGRDVTVTGTTIWKSQHGYLPGELFAFYQFYIFLFLCITIMVMWYTYHYYINYMQRSYEPLVIENFILIVLMTSFVEISIRLIDYTIWNQSGSRQNSFIWCQIFVTVFKNSFTKCVAVLVALGYGMSRNTLSNQRGLLMIIYILTAMYLVVATTNDIILAIADKKMNKLSIRESIVMIDVVMVGTFIMNAINLSFVIFIFVALKNTIQYLHRTGATKKLERTQQLQRIFLCSAIVASICFMLNWYDQHILAKNGESNVNTLIGEEHAWIIDSMYELNYLLVMLCIAYLWKPNQNAIEYAYTKKSDTKETHPDTEIEMCTGSSANPFLITNATKTSTKTASKKKLMSHTRKKYPSNNKNNMCTDEATVITFTGTSVSDTCEYDDSSLEDDDEEVVRFISNSNNSSEDEYHNHDNNHQRKQQPRHSNSHNNENKNNNTRERDFLMARRK